MEFLISNAYAQDAAQQPGLLGPLPLLILMFVAFYFLLIRPQQKKQKQHAEMVAAVKEHDEVITSGGVLGVVTGVSEHYAVIEISENTEVKILKGSISQVVPKGTIKEA